MKALLVLGFLISPFARAQSLTCQDAGGFYGNLSITQASSGQVEINTAQGYGLEISAQLGTPAGHEISSYSIAIKGDQCSFAAGLIVCRGPAQVTPWEWSRAGEAFAGAVELRIEGQGSERVASLSIRDLASKREGIASHRFAAPLGQCE